MAGGLLLLLALGGRYESLRRMGVALAAFAALGFWAARASAPVLPCPAGLLPYFQSQDTLFLGELRGPAEVYPDKVRLHLDLEGVLDGDRWKGVDGGVQVTLGESSRRWLPGDRVLARLRLKRFHNFNNPGGYDYARAQAERGLHARAYVRDDRLMIRLATRRGGLAQGGARAVEAFRRQALAWARGSLDEDTAGFYAAMVLGYRRMLSKPWRERLQEAGVIHLAAISGMHLGYASLAVFFAVRLLVRYVFTGLLHRFSDQAFALWAALAAAGLYALVSGLALPAQRAFIMAALCALALASYRRPEPFSILSAAALLVLAADPNSLGSVSFQLSFGAMIGLLAVYPRLRRMEIFGRREPARWWTRAAAGIFGTLEKAFWVSLSVNLVLLPLLVYHFHGASLAGIPANVVLVPFMGFLVLPAALLSLAVFAVSARAALPFLWVADWGFQGFQVAVDWLADLSWAFFWVGEVPATGVVGFYILLFLPWRSGSWKSRAVEAGAALLCLGIAHVLWQGAEAGPSPRELRATVVDVGQGSSTLVEFPGGGTLLVDGGGFRDDSFDVGRYVLAPFLWHQGIRKLDAVALSHDDSDHRNGLKFVLSHFKVGRFWESGVHHPENEGPLSGIARRRGVPVRRLHAATESIDMGGCRVEVLHPPSSRVKAAQGGAELNDLSLVFQIDHGDTRLVLPGDIDRETERKLFARGNGGKETVLVAAHHGSKHSTGEFILDRLRPRAVIFSCGYENWFGFPAEEVLERCRRRGIPWYRTDRDGAVFLTSDGKGWGIRTRAGEKETSNKIGRLNIPQRRME